MAATPRTPTWGHFRVFGLALAVLWLLIAPARAEYAMQDQDPRTDEDWTARVQPEMDSIETDFIGIVVETDGTPAANAVVVTSAGGRAVVRARSAALGDPIPTGATRTYQVYYRDSDPTYCPNPPGNTWNVSNRIRVVWP